jgi:DNA-binding NtrC family response regulator
VSHDILIVDDDPKIGTLLREALERDGLTAQSVRDPEVAMALLKEHPFEVVVSDLMMPGIDGLEVLRRAKSIRPGCEVVLMTAFASVETVREALKRGAVDYITKPFSIENDLKPLIHAILANPGEDLPAPAQEQPDTPDENDAFAGIVGRGEAMRDLLAKLPRVARSGAPVLLRGESGVGKELVAAAIHRLSPRSHRPMLTINGAALPDTLLESELFGHTKGAFSGATVDREGLFQAAHGGVLFLDEIGEISPTFQPKLLRVLESGEFHRIGDAQRTVKVDVRVIAASNRDLEEAVRQGAFRADLYYRLNVVPLTIPPLRERLEDIPALTDHFLRRFSRERKLHLSARAREAFATYSWPGNVRELANALQHGAVLCDGDEVGLQELPVALQDHAHSCDLTSEADGGSLQAIEVRTILKAMQKTDHNRTRAAQLLGITRRTLGYRIQKYGLDDQISAASRGEEHALRRPGPVRLDGARNTRQSA